MTVRSAWLGLVLLAIGWLSAGCRTPFEPPTRPIANLYPTVYPSTILGEVKPGAVPLRRLGELLQETGLLAPLTVAGMWRQELETVVRGLAHRGYAEIDARRSDCRVRWVVFRLQTLSTGLCLVLEAGGDDMSPAARYFGIDTAAAPKVADRTDIYGRRSLLQTWTTTGDRGEGTIRRVCRTDGLLLYWEIEARIPTATWTP